MRAALFLGAILAVASPAGLSAQSSPVQEASLLVGGSRARYTDSVAGSAALVAARLRLARGGSRAEVETSWAQFASGEWATQLAAQGAWAASLARHWALGLAAGAGLNAVSGGTWSTSAAGGPLAAWAAGPITVSFSATAGTTRQVEGSRLATGTLWGALRYQTGPWRLEASASGLAADTLRLADATAGLSWQRRFVGLEGSVGVRRGDLAPEPWWWQGRLELRPAPGVALELSAGRYPPDLAGFTGGRFASLGVRVVPVGRPERLPAGRRRPALEVQRTGPSAARLAIHLPAARSVAIGGEWNEWRWVPMEPDGSGGWTAVLPLGPGLYRYILLVDGDRRLVPPGAPSSRDDFGGEVGLLIVPSS